MVSCHDIYPCQKSLFPFLSQYDLFQQRERALGVSIAGTSSAWTLAICVTVSKPLFLLEPQSVNLGASRVTGSPSPQSWGENEARLTLHKASSTPTPQTPHILHAQHHSLPRGLDIPMSPPCRLLWAFAPVVPRLWSSLPSHRNLEVSGH